MEKLGIRQILSNIINYNYSNFASSRRFHANLGNPQKQYSLAVSYEQGIGVPLSYSEAAKWFLISAEQGHAEAQYRIALMYDNGLDVEKSKSIAQKESALSFGEPIKSLTGDISNIFNDGNEREKSQIEAAKWYLKAAEQGHIEAQNAIGLIYMEGANGLSQDYSKAIGWLEKAANQGSETAPYDLSAIYCSNKSNIKNMVQSLMWLTVAAGKEQDKLPIMIKLKEEMTEEEIYEAESLAKYWKQNQKTKKQINKRLKPISSRFLFLLACAIIMIIIATLTL